MDYVVFAPEEVIDTEINLPLSKSESARRLILDAFGKVHDDSLIVADCDDTNALKRGLATEQGEVNIGAAGTAMRFLTAYYAATPDTDIVIDGSERMRHRPIAILVEALRKLGADIEYAGEEGFAPLRIHGKQLDGGTIEVDGGVSSQFISALIMAAPSMREPMTLELTNDITSLPYLKMTIAMMQRRGIDIEFSGNEVNVQPGDYGTDSQPIEPDWSAASYWYEITAISAGQVFLHGLREHSLQGDCAIAKFAEQLGVITEFTEDGAQLTASCEQLSRLHLDMSETPDIAQTLVVTSAMLDTPFQFTGVHTLRNKETDRLQALYNEALKVGVVLEIDGDDSISWTNKYLPVNETPDIKTYDDHRMAMAFAPAAIIANSLIVRNAEVVSKSYPHYWEDLRKAGFKIVDINEIDEQQ
jgi:3-phosphoshikimate 1-carboxyvinyltransferase